MSYRFADSLHRPDPARKLSAKPVWHITVLCVQWKTPDDWQRNCPKHVEFYFKNKCQKLVRLVGFIIWNVHDERSAECQTLFLFFFILLFIFLVYEHFSPFRGFSCQTSTSFPRSSERMVPCIFIESKIFFNKFLILNSFHVNSLFHLTHVYFFHHTRHT